LTKYHSLGHWLEWLDLPAAQDYIIIDNFLPVTLYSEIKSFFLTNLNNFSRAGIGSLDKNFVEEGIRGDLTYWLDRERDTKIACFWELIDEMMYIYNRYCFLSLSGYEFHFANYPPGGHYEKHLDQFQNRNNRVISIIFYLNENWKEEDGGQLEILRDNHQSVLIEPLLGRCVMFKSAVVPHRVLESKKNRYSLTGWLLHQPAALGQFLG